VLDARLGDVWLRADMRQPTDPIGSTVGDEVIADATDEVLFAVQSDVDVAEQGRFERAVRQAERFVEDRLLVLRKRRGALVERLEQALLRRDGATGSEARTDAERAVISAQIALEEVDGAISRLERRDDDVFRTFQEHLHQRRYTPPRVERVFDMDLVFE
jgi:hypothetical protein